MTPTHDRLNPASDDATGEVEGLNDAVLEITEAAIMCLDADEDDNPKLAAFEKAILPTLRQLSQPTAPRAAPEAGLVEELEALCCLHGTIEMSAMGDGLGWRAPDNCEWTELTALRPVEEAGERALIEDADGGIARSVGEKLWSVWEQADQNHRQYSDMGDREQDMRFLALGMCGEAGEAANFVKKRWRDGKDHHDDICKEIADTCAYAFMLANTMGLLPGELLDIIAEKQRVFVEKMKTRPASPDGEQDRPPHPQGEQ